jgi:hypothetical protein
MRVVLDTNVLISALIKKGGSRRLLGKILKGEIKLILSKEIVKELMEVLQRPKFGRYVTKKDIRTYIRILTTIASLIETKSKFEVIKDDPGDNKFLNCAYDGKADCVISGNKHLLTLKRFKGIKIISVNEFLRKFT